MSIINISLKTNTEVKLEVFSTKQELANTTVKKGEFKARGGKRVNCVSSRNSSSPNTIKGVKRRLIKGRLTTEASSGGGGCPRKGTDGRKMKRIDAKRTTGPTGRLDWGEWGQAGTQCTYRGNWLNHPDLGWDGLMNRKGTPKAE